ncbi:dihydroorotase [Clostridiaceae bacterium M8S5]|nr:dihydroorotase [Clostridiaceae bacterium M8S5]
MIIQNGYYINMKDKKIEKKDIRVKDGIITEIGERLELANEDQIINAKELYILPGLFDMHVHFREPGYEYKETIKTGAKAAAKGGYTGVLTMPNTNPVIDSVEILKALNEIIKKDSMVEIFPSVAVTTGQSGEVLSNFGELIENGAYAISDDGQPIMNEDLMYEALKEKHKLKIPILIHSEDKRYVNNGCINEGKISRELGVRGISSKSEYEMIHRDIKMAEELDTSIHICHISTKESVEIIREAKSKGIKVTCEVAPHHFYADESIVPKKKSIAKVNPPLRAAQDVAEIIRGIKDGTIDAIATDHAPHSSKEKQKDLYEAPFGISGIELALPLTLTKFEEENIDIFRLVDMMSINPRKILGLKPELIEVGSRANMVIVDLTSTQVITEESIVSKGKNTPFIGEKLKGIVEYTILEEKIIFRRS